MVILNFIYKNILILFFKANPPFKITLKNSKNKDETKVGEMTEWNCAKFVDHQNAEKCRRWEKIERELQNNNVK